MIYVPAKAMPASEFARFCKLLYTKPMLTRNCSVTRQSSRTELHFRHRVPYWSGWIASPAIRDCLSRHWILWRLLPLKPMLNNYSRCVVIWQQENGTRNSTNKVSLCRRVFLKLNCHILPWTQCTVNWIQIQIQIRTCRARLTNCCYKLKCNLFFVLYNSGRYVAETAFLTFIDLLNY